jgi:hypothetical protein
MTCNAARPTSHALWMALTLGLTLAAPLTAAGGERLALETVGPVSSPVFDALRRLPDVRLGSDAAAAVVVDGDALTPQELARDARVRRALLAGRWVLALDVSAAHKLDGMCALVGAANAEPSRAYLVRLAPNASGPADTWVVDLGRAESEFDRFLRLRWGYLQDAPSDAALPDAAEVARQAADFMAGRVTLPELTQVAPPIPSGLLYKRYFFPYNITRTLPGPAVSGGSQTTNVTLLATYQVFLDNNGNPQGDFQFVAFTLDGLSNPTNGERGIAVNREREHAWLQSLVAVTVQPQPGVELDLVATAPANRNGETTYSNDATFNVDFSLSSGPTGSYTWGTKQSYTISDWIALSRSAGLTGNWDFASNSPGKGLANDLAGCDAGWMRTCFFQSGLPNSFNSLNVNPLAFHTEQVWKTRAAVNNVLQVHFNGYQQLLDAFCGHYSPGACWGGEQVRTSANGWTDNHFIDLGAVLPVPIVGLTFDPPQADAGQPVTATLTLARPAPTDVTVLLSSNSVNATVLPSVKVNQGDTSARFQVLTNGNGLGPRSSTTATLQAFYATNFQAQLRIVTP